MQVVLSICSSRTSTTNCSPVSAITGGPTSGGSHRCNSTFYFPALDTANQSTKNWIHLPGLRAFICCPIISGPMVAMDTPLHHIQLRRPMIFMSRQCVSHAILINCSESSVLHDKSSCVKRGSVRESSRSGICLSVGSDMVLNGMATRDRWVSVWGRRGGILSPSTTCINARDVTSMEEESWDGSEADCEGEPSPESASQDSPSPLSPSFVDVGCLSSNVRNNSSVLSALTPPGGATWSPFLGCCGGAEGPAGFPITTMRSTSCEP